MRGGWCLQQLDPCVERPPVRLEQDLHAVDGWVEGVGAEGAALDDHRGGGALGRRLVHILACYQRGEGKLDLADVADADSVWAAGRLDDGAEGAELPVLDVDAHLARRVVRTLPQLDVRVQRPALSAEHHLHLVDILRAKRPGAERAALDEDRVLDVVGALHCTARRGWASCSDRRRQRKVLGRRLHQHRRRPERRRGAKHEAGGGAGGAGEQHGESRPAEGVRRGKESW